MNFAKEIMELKQEIAELKQKETKTRTIWSGNAYETGTEIELSEKLEQNHLYIFTFFAISGAYFMQVPFTYRNSNFQVGYSNHGNGQYFVARFNVLDNGTKMTINGQSINFQQNSALVAIEKVL